MNIFLSRSILVVEKRFWCRSKAKNASFRSAPKSFVYRPSYFRIYFCVQNPARPICDINFEIFCSPDSLKLSSDCCSGPGWYYSVRSGKKDLYLYRSNYEEGTELEYHGHRTADTFELSIKVHVSSETHCTVGLWDIHMYIGILLVLLNVIQDNSLQFKMIRMNCSESFQNVTRRRPIIFTQ